MKSAFIAGLFAAGAAAVASPFDFLQRPKLQPRSHPNPEAIGNATFDQLLDHSDPSLGTFSQRYWFNAEYWGGPGSPVFLLNPGEEDASLALGYLTNDTLPGLYAQLFNGLVIVIERESLPLPTPKASPGLQERLVTSRAANLHIVQTDTGAPPSPSLSSRPRRSSGSTSPRPSPT
jgi:hypothetical protein